MLGCSPRSNLNKCKGWPPECDYSSTLRAEVMCYVTEKPMSSPTSLPIVWPALNTVTRTRVIRSYAGNSSQTNHGRGWRIASAAEQDVWGDTRHEWQTWLDRTSFFVSAVLSTFIIPFLPSSQFHCLISIFLFSCASVRENTLAWVPHCL